MGELYKAGGDGSLPQDHEDQMNRGMLIVTSAFQSKMQALQQEIKGLQLTCQEQRTNVGALQKKNSSLEVELVESHQRHQQLAEENKELRKTVETLDKQITRLEQLRQAVLSSIQDDAAAEAKLGQTGHLTDEFLMNATPITSAEFGLGGLAGSMSHRPLPSSSAPREHDAFRAGAPPADLPGAVGTQGPDGKQFFRQARSRLSYEAFNLFLASIKRLNNQQQTREDTLAEARQIFGPELQDLYKDFEALLNRHGM